MKVHTYCKLLFFVSHGDDIREPSIGLGIVQKIFYVVGLFKRR